MPPPPHPQAQMESGNDGAVPVTSGRSRLNKVIDVKETKRQILFALPMVLTNLGFYLIPMVSVMFAGHLGEIELAGASLANSTAVVTGFSVMIGLSGALETLCGQGFGAKTYKMLGVYLQASCIITIIFSIVVSVLWCFAENILVLLHQEPRTSKAAALYLKYLIPGLFAYGLLQSTLRFLLTQSIILPLVVSSLLSLVLHIGIAHVLVNSTKLGFRGAPMAASISLWVAAIMLGLYVVNAKKAVKTWEGFTLQSWGVVFTTLKLALPSAAMVCLQYCAFEVLILLAGLMPNSEISTSIIGICLLTEAICYMIASGLSAAASTRVSNELGGGNPDRAKRAMGVTLKLTIIHAAAVVGALYAGRNKLAGLFSNNEHFIKTFAAMAPFLVASISCDFITGILSGVARGCGWQHLVAYINLGSFYLIGMPIAAILGFKFKLHAKGLWIGLICGLATQMIGLMLLCRFAKWTRIKVSQDSTTEIVEVV